ncbi:MAG TPA: YfhO family protein, partial [Pyrinomonadaceae bacterium]|nr:YfhO family protein [Pyrinomonadaceae bacterium]
MLRPLSNVLKRRADLGAIAGIVLFFIASFPQGLFGGKYLLANDAFFYTLPLRKVTWDMIRAGVLPLWTPTLMSGYPLLSMAQIGLGYPLTWGYLFLPAYVAEQIYVLAPFLLAPIFTYAYLRELQRSPLAALLGALAFGYGGMMASPLANNGFMPNAVMWLPLLLIGIERSQKTSFIKALLFTTFAYAMSVLTGYGQGFVYIGTIGAVYAFFLSLFAEQAPGKWTHRLTRPTTWRPVFVIAGAGLLAVGLAAFQILETARAVRRSIRSTISYDIFTQGSFTPAMLWRSFTTPVFYVIDMHASVVPIAVLLALVAIWVNVRHRSNRDWRVFFWTGVAIVACWLMLGSSTPLYNIVYYVPLLNRFRVPSRHTFEWTFAVGVLAAYGWDSLAPVFQRYRQRNSAAQITKTLAAIALLLASIVVGIIWWRKSQTLSLDRVAVYNLAKAGFVLLTTGALWRAALLSSERWRGGLLFATLLVTCFVEPSLLLNRWWGGMGFPASRFTTPSEATVYLKQFPPTEHRVYTRVELMCEQFVKVPRFDSANVSAMWNLQNLAGYEPLILERYSNALGGVWLDALRRTVDGKPDGSL